KTDVSLQVNLTMDTLDGCRRLVIVVDNDNGVVNERRWGCKREMMSMLDDYGRWIYWMVVDNGYDGRQICWIVLDDGYVGWL
ncbi:4316_t:CDS:2, partial [Cetraspora pellucida]